MGTLEPTFDQIWVRSLLCINLGFLDTKNVKKHCSGILAFLRPKSCQQNRAIYATNPKQSICMKICKSLPDLQVFQPLLGHQMVQADPVQQQQRD